MDKTGIIQLQEDIIPYGGENEAPVHSAQEGQLPPLDPSASRGLISSSSCLLKGPIVNAWTNNNPALRRLSNAYRRSTPGQNAHVRPYPCGFWQRRRPDGEPVDTRPSYLKVSDAKQRPLSAKLQPGRNTPKFVRAHTVIPGASHGEVSPEPENPTCTSATRRRGRVHFASAPGSQATVGSACNSASTRRREPFSTRSDEFGTTTSYSTIHAPPNGNDDKVQTENHLAKTNQMDKMKTTGQQGVSADHRQTASEQRTVGLQSSSAEVNLDAMRDTFPVLVHGKDGVLSVCNIDVVPYQLTLHFSTKEAHDAEHLSNRADEANLPEQQQQSVDTITPSGPDDPNENQMQESGPTSTCTEWEATERSTERTTILAGDFKNLPPQNSNIVRVFLSSTFSDMKEERNRLTKEAFPQIRQHCKDRGLEFQVVDMRWGVTDDVTNEHLTNALCLEQIEACQRISMGPNFVVLIGDRYGSRPLPLTITEDDWSVLSKSCETRNTGGLELLSQWYRLDTNASPPQYVLQPISSQIEGFGSADEEIRSKTARQWQESQSSLRDVLCQAAKEATKAGIFPEERAEFFFKSITENEVDHGILKMQPPNALCYLRHLKGITDDLANTEVRRYMDVVEKEGKFHVDQAMQDRLHRLKAERLPSTVDEQHIRKYDAIWSGSGATEENNDYLNMLCGNFLHDMKEMIETTIEHAAERDRDKLLTEVLHHANFCQAKCSTFCGCEDTLGEVELFLKKGSRRRSPLIIHGPSGCGKTSVMAMVAQRAREWLGEETVVLVRFLGTSPASSNIRGLLLGVIEQICAVYEMTIPTIDSTSSAVDIFRAFRQTINECGIQHSVRRPLVLLFDSLDQLSSADGAHTLTWLMKDSIPPGIFLIVSTLPEEHGILPLMKRHLDRPGNYLALDQLSPETVQDLMQATMNRHGRTLTQEQYSVLTNLFNSCSHALYLKMLLDEAITWKSYTCVDECVLATTAETAIQSLFTRMEQRYGAKLLSFCFGYITVSDGGLTELELEDVLSCNDEVLNEVFQYHSPPVEGVVRLPPLLWARISRDIGEYLAERQTDNVIVVTWYHRLFFVASRERYLQTDVDITERTFKQRCCQDLAEIFLATSGIKRTVHLSKRGLTIEDADRQVSPQPLEAGNLRKLTKLPYFLYHSADFDNIAVKLKTATLCNLNWLQTKLKGTSFRDVLEDFRMVKHPDREIEIMQDILQLSSSTLSKDPGSLPVEIASRLEHKLPQFPHLDELVDDSLVELYTQEDITMIPLFPCLPAPDGILRATLLGPTHLFPLPGQPLGIVWGRDTGLQVWNMKTFEIERHLCDLSEVEDIHTSPCGKYVFHARGNELVGWDIESGALHSSVAVIPKLTRKLEERISSKRVPPLTCMALSENLAAVRINHQQLLLDGKSLVVINVDENKQVATMVSRVHGEKLCNIAFVDGQKRVVATETQAAQGQPSVIIILETHTGNELSIIELNPKFSIIPRLLKICGDTSSQVVMGLRPADIALVDFVECRLVYTPEEPTSSTGRLVDFHALRSGRFLTLCFDILTKLTHLKEMDSRGEAMYDLVASANQPKMLSVSKDEDLAFVSYVMVGTIEIWDLVQKCLMFELGAHSTGINSCVYDDQCTGLLSTACLDGNLKVWRVNEVLDEKRIHKPSTPSEMFGRATELETCEAEVTESCVHGAVTEQDVETDVGTCDGPVTDTIDEDKTSEAEPSAAHGESKEMSPDAISLPSTPNPQRGDAELSTHRHKIPSKDSGNGTAPPEIGVGDATTAGEDRPTSSAQRSEDERQDADSEKPSDADAGITITSEDALPSQLEEDVTQDAATSDEINDRDGSSNSAAAAATTTTTTTQPPLELGDDELPANAHASPSSRPSSRRRADGQQFNAHVGVTQMTATADGRRLVTCYDDGHPVIHDAATGKRIMNCEVPPDSEGTPLAYTAVDDTILVGLTRLEMNNSEDTFHHTCVLQAWNMNTGKRIETQEEPIRGDIFNVVSGGKHLVLVNREEKETCLHVIGLPDFNIISKHTSERPSSRLVGLLLTSDHEYAVLVEQRSAVVVWGLGHSTADVRKVLKVITTAEGVTLLDNRTLVAGTTYANLLAFKLDNMDNLEETPMWQLSLIPDRHAGEVMAVARSGPWLVTASADKTMKLLDVDRDDKLIRSFSGHTDKVTCVDVSHSADVIVSGSRDQTIRLWRCSSGQQLALFHTYDDVFDVKLCNQSRTVAALVHKYGTRRLVMLYIHDL